MRSRRNSRARPRLMAARRRHQCPERGTRIRGRPGAPSSRSARTSSNRFPPAPVRAGGAPQGLEVRRLAHFDGQAFRAERASRACRARPAHRARPTPALPATPDRRPEPETLFRRQSQRAIEVLGEADPDVAVDDLDLDEAIGRTAAARTAGGARGRARARPPRRRIGRRSPPRAAPGCSAIHGTSASTRRNREPASGRGSRRTPRFPEPRDHLGSQLGRGDDLGRAQQAEHERPERYGVRDGELEWWPIAGVIAAALV